MQRTPRAHILPITIDRMSIAGQLLHNVDVFLSEPAAVQSCSGKKQQIDDVVELERLLKAGLISSTTHQPDLRQR